MLKEVRENKELFEKERVYLEGLLLNAPTVPTVCLTRIASVVDLFGNRIEGYFDESRMLFFSRYGIVTAELIKKKNYKLVFEEEQLRGE